MRAHLLGISTTSDGKHHYLAMKEFEREKEYNRKALEATKNLVKCRQTLTLKQHQHTMKLLLPF